MGNVENWNLFGGHVDPYRAGNSALHSAAVIYPALGLVCYICTLMLCQLDDKLIILAWQMLLRNWYAWLVG
jgi:hypothetical protein